LVQVKHLLWDAKAGFIKDGGLATFKRTLRLPTLQVQSVNSVMRGQEAVTMLVMLVWWS
jgi:hypothetical protein